MTTPGTGAKGLDRRGHPQMPAAVAANEADHPENPQEAAVQGEQGDQREGPRQHSGQDFDNHHTDPLPSLSRKKILSCYDIKYNPPNVGA